MTANYRARLLRRLLHDDTFELFVAPAVADLHHEPSLAAWLTVWTSFLGAVITDAIGDVDDVMNDVGLMVGLVAMQACYYGGMLLVLVANIRADEVLVRLSNGGAPLVAGAIGGVVLASSIPTLLCFWPPRRTLNA